LKEADTISKPPSKKLRADMGEAEGIYKALNKDVKTTT
jgi:hypothetical protein